MQEQTPNPPIDHAQQTVVEVDINRETSEEFLDELQAIKKELKISNSFSRKFSLALIYGLGTVIGATVVVALLVYILSLFTNIVFIGKINNWIIHRLEHSTSSESF